MFGRLTAIERADVPGRWRCRCSCGAEKSISRHVLRSGKAQSCGCLRRELAVARGTTHGTFVGNRTGRPPPEYTVLAGMIQRCEDPDSEHYAYYGGRGITVCARWRHDFAAFLSDMGPRPSSQHSIDRIDNAKGYEPGNCRWATRTEQMRNTRHNVLITFDGETLCAAEWSARTGVPERTLIARVRRGVPPERALSTKHLPTGPAPMGPLREHALSL